MNGTKQLRRNNLMDIKEQLVEVRAYLDQELHPLVSPDHWDIYSNLCDMIDNISILLKEQEPRVLTYEEADAIAHQTEETAIYLERKSHKSLYAAIAGDTQGRVPNISWMGKERNYQDEYGKTWRCWSAKPTDEQREAVPWME